MDRFGIYYFVYGIWECRSYDGAVRVTRLVDTDKVSSDLHGFFGGFWFRCYFCVVDFVPLFFDRNREFYVFDICGGVGAEFLVCVGLCEVGMRIDMELENENKFQTCHERKENTKLKKMRSQQELNMRPSAC